MEDCVRKYGVHLLIIDNMMNLELMFEASLLSGDERYREIAISHADKTIANHFRDNASSYHVVDYDPETGEILGRCTAQGYSGDTVCKGCGAVLTADYAEKLGADRYAKDAMEAVRYAEELAVDRK